MKTLNALFASYFYFRQNVYRHTNYIELDEQGTVMLSSVDSKTPKLDKSNSSRY